MAAIVDLREMSDEKLEGLLDEAREEMYNLRFRHASSRLDDFSQLRRVRREIAQYETVLQMRDLAVNIAAQQPEIAAALKGREWYGQARFDYHVSAWKVELLDEGSNDEIATALVNLNQKKSSSVSRRKRRQQQAQQSSVINFEVVG